MKPSSIATAVMYHCARIAGNLICGVPDADISIQKSFAVHAMTISI